MRSETTNQTDKLKAQTIDALTEILMLVLQALKNCVSSSLPSKTKEEDKENVMPKSVTGGSGDLSSNLLLSDKNNSLLVLAETGTTRPGKDASESNNSRKKLEPHGLRRRFSSTSSSSAKP